MTNFSRFEIEIKLTDLLPTPIVILGGSVAVELSICEIGKCVEGLEPYHMDYGRDYGGGREAWIWYYGIDLDRGWKCSKETEKAHVPTVLWHRLVEVTNGEEYIYRFRLNRISIDNPGWDWHLCYKSREEALVSLQEAVNLFREKGARIPDPTYEDDWKEGIKFISLLEVDGQQQAFVRVQGWEAMRRFPLPNGFIVRESLMAGDWVFYFGPYDNLPDWVKLPEPDMIIDTK